MEHFGDGGKSRYDAAFTEAAIHALGVLQDKKAHSLLSHLSLSNHPEHTPFRGVLLDAIRRINDANEIDRVQKR